MRKLTRAEISTNRLSLEALGRSERLPVYVLLDNIRSLYNVGSIFRTCDGARVSGLILTGYTPHPPRKEIEKTALGATSTVPWNHEKDPLRSIATLRNKGVKICLLEQTTGSRPYYELQQTSFPLCLVIGNEISGVSREIVEVADFAIDIPMMGHKQSLNVAVAAGIAIFDCVRIFRKA